MNPRWRQQGRGRGSVFTTSTTLTIDRDPVSWYPLFEGKNTQTKGPSPQFQQIDAVQGASQPMEQQPAHSDLHNSSSRQNMPLFQWRESRSPCNHTGSNFDEFDHSRSSLPIQPRLQPIGSHSMRSLTAWKGPDGKLAVMCMLDLCTCSVDSNNAVWNMMYTPKDFVVLHSSRTS